MTATHAFSGTVISGRNTYHGEGPTYDAATDTAWWFSIGDCELIEHSFGLARTTVHRLPFMASVLARIDARRQLIVSEQGLHVRDRVTGALELIAEIEADRPEMRSNDGRTHPSGALWFGTMSKTGENRIGAGTIYHVAGTQVTPLYPNLSIPNGICFSPDGATGYFVDTLDGRYMKVALDPATGLPVGEPDIFVDGRGRPGGIDGSVCASDGSIYNARWGVGEIHRYLPDGTLTDIWQLPPRQTTCPAFIGREADRLMVVTAGEDYAAGDLAADPQAGFAYDLGIRVAGRFDPAFKL